MLQPAPTQKLVEKHNTLQIIYHLVANCLSVNIIQLSLKKLNFDDKKGPKKFVFSWNFCVKLHRPEQFAKSEIIKFNLITLTLKIIISFFDVVNSSANLHIDT